MTRPDLNAMNDREKLSIQQYDRMQDLVTTYATLTVKILSVLCGGALVSIGAAFVNFLSLQKNINEEAFKLIKETLTSAFAIYAIAFGLTIIALVLIYFARVQFLIDAKDGHNLKAKTRGNILEGISVFSVLLAIVFIFYGFWVMGAGFSNFPI